MAKFTLAVNRPFGGTDFIDVVAWRQDAEACKNFKKDQMVLVEGRIQIRSFEDQAGQRRWATEVVARVVQGTSGSTPMPQASGPKETLVEDAGLASDLPF